MILVTEIRDNNGGVGRNIFNEGVFVNDIYAYPQVDASYMPSVKVQPLCLNEDSTDRNTCAFELVRQWTIKQAEEKLMVVRSFLNLKPYLYPYRVDSPSSYLSFFGLVYAR